MAVLVMGAVAANMRSKAMTDLLTSHEICRLAGCTYRQLDYWCRIGLISPVVEAEGSGTQRLWGAESVSDIRDHLAAIQACPYHPHGRQTLVSR